MAQNLKIQLIVKNNFFHKTDYTTTSIKYKQLQYYYNLPDAL